MGREKGKKKKLFYPMGGERGEGALTHVLKFLKTPKDKT